MKPFMDRTALRRHLMEPSGDDSSTVFESLTIDDEGFSLLGDPPPP